MDKLRGAGANREEGGISCDLGELSARFSSAIKEASTPPDFQDDIIYDLVDELASAVFEFMHPQQYKWYKDHNKVAGESISVELTEAEALREYIAGNVVGYVLGLRELIYSSGGAALDS